jgi:phage terminase small subunit
MCDIKATQAERKKHSRKVAEKTADVPEKAENIPESPTYEDLLAALPPRQARFVEEFLIDLNKLQAALRAGYSESYALKKSYKLMEYVGIRAAVDAGKAEISKRIRINQDEVIRQLVKIGFANMGTYAKWGPGYVTINRSEDLTEDQRCAVAEVVDTTTEKGSSVRLKLHNSITALLGILDRVKPGADDPQKVEHTIKYTYFPPEPKTMAEYEIMIKKMKEEADK